MVEEYEDFICSAYYENTLRADTFNLNWLQF
jgi:hypothetical protein